MVPCDPLCRSAVETLPVVEGLSRRTGYCWTVLSLYAPWRMIRIQAGVRLTDSPPPPQPHTHSRIRNIIAVKTHRHTGTPLFPFQLFTSYMLRRRAPLRPVWFSLSFPIMASLLLLGEALARAPFKRVGLKLQRPVLHCPAFAAGRLQNSPAAADSLRDPEPANQH